ncbi:hypothetical protein PHLCEN_2v1818 [Hermanssonia centrifuga]|uniref:Uncharacterized protein n=1 Tax=Hermanssonia centrifuga TaxID=98765 RepID=A0A2R6RVX7_9APHY|nr:hypothetical protein PHLCEN_2v1818 [Hermanssonia centrifuga]
MPPDSRRPVKTEKRKAREEEQCVGGHIDIILEDWNADKEVERPSPNFCVLMDLF